MSNYFRITVYYPEKNVSAIIDSNGKFEKLWQLSSFLIQKGFKVLEIGNDENFSVGNILKAEPNTEKLILRACDSSKPDYNGSNVSVKNKYYIPEKKNSI